MTGVALDVGTCTTQDGGGSLCSGDRCTGCAQRLPRGKHINVLTQEANIRSQVRTTLYKNACADGGVSARRELP
ncbi:unnamed protein product [Arctia plantaginis]|uniref:Uncharacterized protein n=1 Tax=Arctia plantaginis TaxID=874455 RepID=A0A8S1BIQ4_ARCPL|nr:unnamed protein product [Arctia plantaginis]